MYFKDKFRETIDPFTITFKSFELIKVLGYAPAGNDVFVVKGIYDKRIVTAYIKIERQVTANIRNEIDIIKKINKTSFNKTPVIIEYDLDYPYIITLESNGLRLSQMEHSLIHLNNYGLLLSQIHSLNISCENVKKRKFFEIQEPSFYYSRNLTSLYYFLTSNKVETSSCFIHGDFHYANILFDGEQVKTVLDYELSGIGVREEDTAWAIFLRSTQNFLDTSIEREAFLNGYKSGFNRKAVDYYTILLCAYFYNEDLYKQKLRKIIAYSLISFYNLNDWKISEIDEVLTSTNTVIFARSEIYFDCCIKITNQDEINYLKENSSYLLDNKDNVVLLKKLKKLNNITLDSKINIFCEVFSKIHKTDFKYKYKSFIDIIMSINNDQKIDFPDKYLLEMVKQSKYLYNKYPSIFLLHGDLHFDNIVSDNALYVAIDPHAIIGPEIIDLGRFLSNEFYLGNDIDYIINRLEKNLGYPYQDILRALFVDIALRKCWDIEDQINCNLDGVAQIYKKLKKK